MLLKGAYCVGEHIVDPQCLFYNNAGITNMSFDIYYGQ